MVTYPVIIDDSYIDFNMSSGARDPGRMMPFLNKSDFISWMFALDISVRALIISLRVLAFFTKTPIFIFVFPSVIFRLRTIFSAFPLLSAGSIIAFEFKTDDDVG